MEERQGETDLDICSVHWRKVMSCHIRAYDFNTILKWLAFVNKLEVNFQFLFFCSELRGGSICYLLTYNSHHLFMTWLHCLVWTRNIVWCQDTNFHSFLSLCIWAFCIPLTLVTAAVTVKDLSSSVWHQHWNSQHYKWVSIIGHVYCAVNKAPRIFPVGIT